jgi:hypothetical protein
MEQAEPKGQRREERLYADERCHWPRRRVTPGCAASHQPARRRGAGLANGYALSESHGQPRRDLDRRRRLTDKKQGQQASGNGYKKAASDGEHGE